MPANNPGYWSIAHFQVLSASNLDATALTVVTRKLEDVLDSKNSAIKDLQYELARVCKVSSALDHMIHIFRRSVRFIFIIFIYTYYSIFDRNCYLLVISCIFRPTTI